MNTDKYYYQIEVSLHPSTDPLSRHKPYYWVIWEYSKADVNRPKTNGGFGWAVSPREAWEEAIAYYEKATGADPCGSAENEECYQIVYTLENGNICYSCLVFQQKHDAAVFACNVQSVADSGEEFKVDSFKIESRPFVAAKK